MADIVMPRLSDSMEEGTVLQWLKAVGDEVAVGDELVEIETDKANMAYESDVAGTLSEILVQEGETVAIGTPIARVGDSGEGSEADQQGTSESTAGPVAAEGGALRAGHGPSSTPPSPTPPAEETTDGERPKASPLARRRPRCAACRSPGRSRRGWRPRGRCCAGPPVWPSCRRG